MGYTDLLLRESVGILGALQRKFLQRVKANTERLGILLDDLIRITALDMGRFEIKPESIDVGYLIEEVIVAAVEGEDLWPFEQLTAVLASPYEDQPGQERHAAPPRSDQIVHQTFCGT